MDLELEGQELSVGQWSGVRAAAAFCRPDRIQYRLRAEACADTRADRSHLELFDALHQRKTRIEDSIDEPLEWDRPACNGVARISLYFPEPIMVSERERWPEAREWPIDALGRMRETFTPHLDKLP